ncbi:protein transport protein SEC16B-like protein [Iris pallida]|uniref:Protein transport protein SEC16B-like protein n=1 Tax=Iris pallida TaxID=29817 RepID=A0AAX6IC65_IRIPA|nr:protein transport protein SEC16B-like protein [Iris pallida]
MDSTPPFQLDDQTDKDFFDKLAGDEFDGSKSERTDISRVFSDLSLCDADIQENSSKENLLAAEGNLQADSSGSVAADSAKGLSAVKNDVSKGISVREVQWSAFSVGSEQFGQEYGLGSDLLIDNGDVLDAKAEEFGSNEYGSSEAQSSDQNDPQYWENLYPGWKYDMNTGQWYQLDAYGFSGDSQVNDLNTSSIHTQERLDSLGSGSTEVSYLQLASQSVLETIAEDCTVSSVSNWNRGSYGTIEYPPNMVFDLQYPEWYYDTITQQWYTLESYSQRVHSSSNSAVQEQPTYDVNTSSALGLEQSQSFYGGVVQPEQHNIQSQGSQDFGGNWNAYESNYTPENSLYTTNGVQSERQISQVHGSQKSGGSWDTSGGNSAQSWSSYSNISQSGQYTSQGSGTQQYGGNWNTSMSNNQSKIWLPEPVAGRNVSGSQNFKSRHGSMARSQIGQHSGFKPSEPVVQHKYASANGTSELNSFVPKESTYQFNQPKVEQAPQAYLSNSYYGDQNNQSKSYYGDQNNLPNSYYGDHNNLSNDYYGDQNMSNCSQQSLQGANASYSQFPYAPNQGRPSAGRPPHALVAFGFGGKLIVMNSFGTNLGVGSQGNAGGAVSILSLSEVVAEKTNALSIISSSSCSYFHALCQQPFPGPLVGGNAATKDVNKWIDERIMSCESSSMDFQRGEFLKLLLSLLKILCQHYGKLRSPFGADPSLEEIDSPESAVTKLFAYVRKNGAGLTEYGSFTHCMKNLPPEAQIKATATEVQNLLVSGRRKEALEYAQEGQLWGPALV